MNKRTTINDLAKALGLSPTLISMVLNGKGDENKISSATQKKVFETAKKLNYTPNQNARALRTGKTNVIGLIVPDISNAFYSRLARLFEDLLDRKSYRLIMGSTDEDADNEKKLMRIFVDQNVDGIIAASTFQNAKSYAELNQAGKAVVLFDRVFEKSGVPSVSVQNTEGAMLAVDAFVKNGKNKIGFLTLSPSYISPLADRFDGFKQAVKKHKIKTTADSVCEIKFSEIENKFDKIIAAWLKKNSGMNAILVANNNLATHLMKFVRKTYKGKNPYAIISFDDHAAFELSTPSITAIAQPIEHIAEAAVDLLMLQLENKDVRAKELVLPVTPLLRESHK